MKSFCRKAASDFRPFDPGIIIVPVSIRTGEFVIDHEKISGNIKIS